MIVYLHSYTDTYLSWSLLYLRNYFNTWKTMKNAHNSAAMHTHQHSTAINVSLLAGDMRPPLKRNFIAPMQTAPRQATS